MLLAVFIIFHLGLLASTLWLKYSDFSHTLYLQSPLLNAHACSQAALHTHCTVSA